MVLSRALKLCNFLDWKDIKVKYAFAFALLVSKAHIAHVIQECPQALLFDVPNLLRGHICERLMHPSCFFYPFAVLYLDL